MCLSIAEQTDRKQKVPSWIAKKKEITSGKEKQRTVNSHKQSQTLKRITNKKMNRNEVKGSYTHPGRKTVD